MMKIFSKDLIFVPKGEQEKKFFNWRNTKIFNRISHDDILINKLITGMEIYLECYCIKGIGKALTKCSPLYRAYYRLMNKINILEEFKDDDAQELS